MTRLLYRLLLTGPPGVGKGAYSGRAALSLNCNTVSSGELLRQEVARGSPIGKQVKGLIEQGVFVPDALITTMVVQHLDSLRANGDEKNGYILDGFPRNASQARSLWESNALPIDHVINLSQPTNVIVTKVSSRRMCPRCGFVYNAAKIDEGGIKMDPLMPKVDGVCDKCGSTEALITRADDQLSVVKKRLSEYEAVALPMQQFYQEKGVLHEFPVLGGVTEYLPKLVALIRSWY